jgi:glyoxylase-like metal-dependent hydrolase (beta-lactamase superfamily II)
MMSDITRPKRIELPTGWDVGSVNAYLFTGPEPILVDGGIRIDGGWEALTQGLGEHGVAVSDLSRVVITHPHVDHFGLAGRIVAESDAEVWISELGAPWLLNMHAMWQDRIHFYHHHFLAHLGFPADVIEPMIANMQQVASKVYDIPVESVVSFRLDGVLQMGGMSWQVIHTPGHAYRQTCFYQPETRQLISADHILAITPTPVVERGPDTNERIPSLPQFLDSLALVEKLDVDMVYPGHGRPFSDLKQLIQKQRNRIDERKLECLELVKNGHNTIPALLNVMYAHYPQQYRFVGLWMLVGYLDLLLAEGLIQQQTIDGTWHYD